MSAKNTIRPLQKQSLLLIFVLSALNFSVLPQSTTIVKIIDNSKYLTSGGDTILPYSIHIPAKTESEKFGTSTIMEINDWISEYLLGQEFTISIIDTIAPSLFSSKLLRERFNGQQDYAELLVDMGFAIVDSTLNDLYSKNLLKTQSLSIKNQNGIWKIFKPEVNPNSFSSIEYKGSDSGFGIKFSSLAMLAISSVLTWDYAIQVSDLSKAIDDAKEIEGYDTGPLERERTRKLLYTAVCGITAVVSLYIAIESFEVKATTNSINFRYKF